MNSDVMNGLHPIFADVLANSGSSSRSRYNQKKPFVLNWHVYATDGRIIVRTKTQEPNTTGEQIPPADELNWSGVRRPVQMPEVPTPKMVSCYECDGLGAFGECWACDDGSCSCPTCGQGEVECDKCDGTGVVPVCGGKQVCDMCKGSCQCVDHDQSIKIGSQWFKVMFASILAKHSASVFEEMALPAHLYFTVGDVEGLLVPCTAPDGAE